ncbi:scavenger receptor class B member 1-like isoform X1 [Danaus plexippus]|uniref:scavenger receptor class B member 1-like isoform X1 n=1 Tax=Danaus plexippus TaxID=13037 RepID=UPI002AB1D13F|nr:scavenger receptor class B member 1-like isoform X1 [Danaus plexippus]
MKELVQIWNRVTGRQYSSVNVQDKELRELSNNRVKKGDIDTSVFEANLSECEGLNNKFNEDYQFNERKDQIINRLFTRRRSSQSIAKQPNRLFILFVVGFLSLITGLLICFLHPYDAIFRWKVVMSDGGEIFEMWRKPQVELYAKIYLFNITNSHEYMSGVDTKLKVQEVGPYVYREIFEHADVVFNDNGTLSTIPRHPLVWQPELSEGNREDDVLYLPHIALLSIGDVVSEQSYWSQLGLNQLISVTNSQPIAKMTAKEFMMGYESQLMTLGNTFLPGWIYFDKLGLIDRMYDFNGDYETIFTGENDETLSGLIDTYRGSTDLPHWDGKHCSNIQYASDGTKFRGSLTLNDSSLFYRKSLCRAAPLVPVEEGIKNGFRAYKYTFPEHMLDNGKVLEENKCFCRLGKCLPEGLIDVTDCYYGFPIALSYPHFYKGEEVLFSKVEGLQPDEEKHKTEFWIQPDSGLPLDISSKFQINMALGDLSMITNAGKFSNMYLPMLWFDIRMYTLPASMEQKFKIYLNILPFIEKSLMYLSFISGSALIMATSFMIYKLLHKTYNGGKKVKFNWMNANSKDIYSPCEIPMGDGSDDTACRTHGDRFKQLGHRLSDRVQGSVNNVIDSFQKRKDSLIDNEDSSDSNAYKRDSTYIGDITKYHEIRQTDSDDEYYKYLEVVDDEFGDGDDKKDTYIHIN